MLGRLQTRAAVLVFIAILVAAGRWGAAQAGPAGDATSPTWSPNGKEIAFVYTPYTEASTFRIVAAPATGRVHTLLAGKNPNGCCDPMMWAAGGRILYISNFTLMSLPARGGKPKPLFSSTPWFIVSPNKETAAFTDGCGCGHAPDAIGLVNVTGGKPYVIPKPDEASDEIDSFSPDGTELIFTRYASINDGDYGPATLMVEHIAGGTPIPLTQSGIIGAPQLPPESKRLQWSPDGRWIAFVRNLTLEVANTSGEAARVIATDVGAFSWSPTSALIAYDCCTNHANQYLFTVDPQNGHRTKLGGPQHLNYLTEDSLDWPQWSPDGTKLAFMARPGPGYQPIHIWVTDADGRKLKKIA